MQGKGGRYTGEDGYDRVDVEVTTLEGEKITAWIYQLQPQQA